MKGFIEVKAFVKYSYPSDDDDRYGFRDTAIDLKNIKAFHMYYEDCLDINEATEEIVTIWSNAKIICCDDEEFITLDTYDEIKHKIEKAQKGYCIKEVFERYEEHVQNADFVEVVRCKDCVHLKQTKNGGWCKLHNTFPLNDYYCANGKKELK